MAIENEAFIDLENMLHDRVDRLWVKQWSALQRDINKSANAGDWDTAFSLCDAIDFTPVIDKSERIARTAAEAALFLGASRITPNPSQASFMGEVDEMIVDNAVKQWAAVLKSNAQEGLRLQSRNLVSNMEIERQQDNMVIKADDLGKVGKAGTQYSKATASLMISRMNTYGFMLEARAKNITRYRVNEVMDTATCPVCRQMHNQHFDVSDGWQNISGQMMADDPESIRATNPFPSKSNQNIKRLRKMGPEQLVQAGMNLPPYHPNCRGVVDMEDQTVQEPAALGGLAMGERMLDTEGLSANELAARMFGDFDDIEDAFLAAALGVGAGAEFSDN